MKTLLMAGLIIGFTSLVVAQQTTPYTVTERGADYRIWQKTMTEGGTNSVHQYTEIASGLNYTNASGQLVESKEQIDILPTGGAAAIQGQHKVYFPSDIYNGVLQVVTPDGYNLYSRPLGISYDDGSNCVWIGTLKHSTGLLISSNKVVYPDAFENLKADLVCTYRRGGFESDLIFRTKPAPPETFGLAAESSTIQLFTEFFNTQDPQQIPSMEDESLGLLDHTLNFGKLTMSQGKAFGIGATNVEAGNEAPVFKTWALLEGRKFLVEEVPLDSISEDLDVLPSNTNSLSAIPYFRSTEKFSSNKRVFPPLRKPTACTNEMQIAALDLAGQPGMVLDYFALNTSQTNYTFHSNITYYVSGSVGCFGLTIFEGGTVIKCAPNGSIAITPGPYGSASIFWKGSASRPAIFTAKDDDTVGETISGSTGTPVGYYGSPALVLSSVPSVQTISGLRICFAATGIFFGGSSANIYDAQFVRCQTGLQLGGSTVLIANGLFANTATDSAFVGVSTLNYQNTTFSDASVLASGTPYQTGCSVSLINCILANVNNPITGVFLSAGGNYNGFFNSPTTLGYGTVHFTTSISPFVTAGAAHHYLAPGCIFINNGTTAIDSSLLSDLQTSTVYAPQNGSAPDNDGQPDLGYHYPVNEDSDHDGLPDKWEWQYFGNFDQSGNGDFDGDGLLNIEEYIFGLDPTVNQLPGGSPGLIQIHTPLK